MGTYDPSFLNDAFGNFNSDCSFISIKSGKSAILLEDEFNESQIIQSEHRANLIRNMTSSGFIDKPTELMAKQNGGLVFKYDNDTKTDIISLYQSSVVGNGYIININSDKKDSVGNYVDIKLTSNKYNYDFVFLEFWLKDLSPIETTEQYKKWENPIVYKYGCADTDNGTISDYKIITGDVNFNGNDEPTTGRVQLQWTIKVENMTLDTININEQDLYNKKGYLPSANDKGLYYHADKTTNIINNMVYSLPMFIIDKSTYNYNEKPENSIKDLRKEVYINNDKFYEGKIKPLTNTIDIICEILGIDLVNYAKYPFVINKYDNLTTGGYLMDDGIIVSSGCLIKNDKMEDVDDYVIITSCNRKNPGFIGEINVEKYSNRCYITNTGNANMNMKNYMISNIGKGVNNSIYRLEKDYIGDISKIKNEKNEKNGIVGVSSYTTGGINISEFTYDNSFIYAYPIQDTNGQLGELYVDSNSYIKATGNGYTGEIEWVILDSCNNYDNIKWKEINLNSDERTISLEEFGMKDIDNYSVFFCLPVYNSSDVKPGKIGDIYAIIKKGEFTIYNTGDNIENDTYICCMIIKE